MSNDTIVWLTVVLFVLHEFQEIIFIKPWVARNSGDPRMARHAFMAMKDVSTSAIAMMIGEEFLLFSVFAACAVFAGWYSFFWGFLLLYTAHLVGHIAETRQYGWNTPSFLTSVIALPWCVYALYALMHLHLAAPVASAVWAVVFTPVITLNFRFIYWLAPRADAWLSRKYYQQHHV
jgi:hypothetical protein